MSGQLMLGLAAVTLFGTGQLLRSQSEPKEGPRIALGSVRAVPQVYVSLRLRAADKQIFVPYCGQPERGTTITGILCTLGTHLEVRRGSEWYPARPKTSLGAILGGLRLDLADGSLLPPGIEEEFEYVFSRRYFEVDPGQTLRVAVDVWPDEQSMRGGRKSTQIASPAFECPQDVLIYRR